MTLIAIHVIQNYVPSNLNRDENGDPKDVIFGGFRRGRISSQSQKYVIRNSDVFQENLPPQYATALRSKLPDLVSEHIRNSPLADQLTAEQMERIRTEASRIGKAEKPVPELSAKPRKARAQDKAEAEPVENALDVDDKNQLMLLLTSEVEYIARELVAFVTAEKPPAHPQFARQPLPKSVPIALWGRMITSPYLPNVEAACQVAHAITTHKLASDFDFYTAMDDLVKDDRAGFLGHTAFNSSTYYRYMNVHWETLLDNLDGDANLALAAIQATLQAVVNAVPIGKKNAFAHYNPPDFLMVEMRRNNTPVNYANAFARPVPTPPRTSWTEDSIEALARYVARVDETYQHLPVRRATLTLIPESQTLEVRLANTDQLTEWVTDTLGSTLA